MSYLFPQTLSFTLSKHAWRLHFLAIVLLFQAPAVAQTVAKAPAPCIQKDLPGIIREWRNKPPKKNVSKNHSLLIIPSAGVNPTNGFMLGAAGQYVTRDKRPKSLYSYLQGTMFITTKKQMK